MTILDSLSNVVNVQFAQWGEVCTYAPASGDPSEPFAMVKRLGLQPPAWVHDDLRYPRAEWAEIKIPSSALAAEPVRDADTVTDASGRVWTMCDWKEASSGLIYLLACSRDERGTY